LLKTLFFFVKKIYAYIYYYYYYCYYFNLSSPLGNPVVDGRIILIWIFRKWDVGVWTGSIWLRIGTGGGHL
jgi:hypothetical protein